MEVCNLGNNAMEMEAQQQREQSQAGGCTDDPAAVLTCLTFLEQKIAHLRGIIGAAPRQMVSAELSCIAMQLVSISKSLAATGGAADQDDGATRSPGAAVTSPNDGDSDSSDHDLLHAEEEDGDGDSDGRMPPAGSYEVIELGKEEILAPHVHSCKVCGKGFKRDANLRMHMRAHGDEYKSSAALANPAKATAAGGDAATTSRSFYSCPQEGCRWNRKHAKFQPLKSVICAKNHYKRSHCPKMYVCNRCNRKHFSVLSDLRTHEKHCGDHRWLCSCGTSFSRKDKLVGHLALFTGHQPAVPLDRQANGGRRSSSMSTSTQLGT